MKNERPPRLAAWILSRIAAAGDQHAVLGDCEEIYSAMVAEKGLPAARSWYRSQVLRSLPLFVLNRISGSAAMFRSYLQTALRNMLKHRSYSLLSISGLAIGLACCFIIILYLAEEASYDDFHRDPASIYRVVRQMPDAHGPATRNPLAPALKENFPEIELAVRTWLLREPTTFWLGEKDFRQEGVLFADPEFFRLFTYEFIAGHPGRALDGKFSLVLTESAAKRYFGAKNQVGRTLSFDGEFDLNVTAVIKDVPHNSHLQFEVVLPLESLNAIAGYVYGYDPAQYRLLDDWMAGMINTYLKLVPEADPAALERKFPDFLKIYAPRNKELLDETLYLQPVRDIHLHSQYPSDTDKISDIKFVYLLAAIGLVILLMSCFNSVNLTTARFASRLKEVAIRKVVGALKRQLVAQFLIESFLSSLLAFILGFLLVLLLAPAISGPLDYSLGLRSLHSAPPLLIIFLTGALAALLSGSYPAIFFSAFQPVNVIKGGDLSSRRRKGVRSALVIFQFTITISLLVGTGTVFRQVRYMKSKDLGYEKEQVLIVPVKDDDVRNRSEALKNELLQAAGVSSVSFSSVLPSRIIGSTTMDLNIDGERKVFEMNTIATDTDFLDVYKIALTQGRYFSRDYPADAEGAVVLNERAAAVLNWRDPVGKELRVFGGPRRVIGVVRDFHFQPLHNSIGPLAMRLGSGRYASLRVSTSDIPQTLAEVRGVFQMFAPRRAFEYFFLDDDFRNLYRAEQNFGRTIGYFTLFAIMVSSLGLFGLSLFLAEKKTKEIGIRKVLGASAAGLALMLYREFARLALLANLIAWPVAYVVLNRWLQRFAYRVEVALPTFALAAIVTLGLAFLAVGYQSVKVASANPVKSLRYE
jgi:putative ABC transport system permease protein